MNLNRLGARASAGSPSDKRFFGQAIYVGRAYVRPSDESSERHVCGEESRDDATTRDLFVEIYNTLCTRRPIRIHEAVDDRAGPPRCSLDDGPYAT